MYYLEVAAHAERPPDGPLEDVEVGERGHKVLVEEPEGVLQILTGSGSCLVAKPPLQIDLSVRTSVRSCVRYNNLLSTWPSLLSIKMRKDFNANYVQERTPFQNF